VLGDSNDSGVQAIAEHSSAPTKTQASGCRNQLRTRRSPTVLGDSNDSGVQAIAEQR
jgi:hypothetical protein